ncbi:TPA_asm: coat protein [ssRNA phage SRR6960799_29]|uniref:Coat protein n=1 Tax=ssRNA phage SRR6960799_29 TaxID=2786586 RepID=A0A8S5L426_9VIRU|nr:coat protein [ssRNA phage SRR6960799_29]DAD52275.1 TPA_asm: coat protein [ssRNA phage SRR6960799_29]
MTDIVLKSTVVAPTGTGITLTPWNLQGPKAEYVELAPAGGINPLKVVLNRIDAVPTKAYEGAHRAQVKFMQPRVHPVTGVVWPNVATVSFSHPGFLTSTQKVAFETQVLLAMNEAVIRSFVASGTVPQS